jgi:hypothetical protein
MALPVVDPAVGLVLSGHLRSAQGTQLLPPMQKSGQSESAEAALGTLKAVSVGGQ